MGNEWRKEMFLDEEAIPDIRSYKKEEKFHQVISVWGWKSD